MTCQRLAPTLFALLILALAGPASARITVDVKASRVQGAAPLAVQFNASGTTHSDKAIDTFRQVFYEWDFGARAAGRNPGHWRRGISEALANPLSKDEDCCSPISAHVYDDPGTYTATVTARDRAGNVATRSVTITVQDPNAVWSGTATVCVSASGNFSGCPSGARQVRTSDFVAALDSHCRVGGSTPVRCLLRRGDKFTANTNVSTGKGPHLIGAFGSGVDPLIDHSKNDNNSLISPRGDDIRIMNLRVTRTANVKGTSFINAGAQNSANHVLIYRTDAENSDRIFYSNAAPCSEGTQGYWFIVENDIGPTQYAGTGNGIMWGGRRQTFMGNHIHRAQSSSSGGDGHEFRSQCLQQFYIGHNTIAPGTTKGAVLTLRAPNANHPDGIGDACAKNRDCVIPPDHPGCSQRNVVTGNFMNLEGYPLNGGVGWGPSSATNDTCIQDNVIERHYMRASEQTKRGWGYSGRRSTMRNMVFAFDNGGLVQYGINLSVVHENAPSHNLRDNEVYDIHVSAENMRSDQAHRGFVMDCKDQKLVREVKLYNFFMYTPGERSRVMDVAGNACVVLAKEAVCASDTNDDSRTCTVQGNPFGTKRDPSRLDTFLLSSSSNMVNAGTPRGSLYGILGNRVVDGRPDVGAGEVVSGGVVQLIPPLLLPRQ